MKQAKGSSLTSGLRERAAGALRPSVEALLLAAVALGCAQAGWTVLTPSNASATASTTDETNDNLLTVADVRSPFAPEAGDIGGSHVINALLSSIELKSVRVMTDAPERSGALFALADGERAFLVGQEVTDGVTLASVDAGHVLLSYDGGQRRIDITQQPSFSFARAMMGLEPAPGGERLAEPQVSFARAMLGETPAPVEAAATIAPQDAPQGATVFAAGAAPNFSDADRAWFAATLTQAQTDGGWRIAGPLPQAVSDAGLREGDVVVAINGATDPSSALAAAQSGRVNLEVARGDARVTVAIALNERS